MIKKIILGIGAIIVIAGIAINVAKSYLKPTSATETPITTSQPTQTISLIDTLNQLNAIID